MLLSEAPLDHPDARLHPDAPSRTPGSAPARRRGVEPGWARLLIGIIGLATASACGRKATVEDCEQIVRRIAELELKDVVPQAELGSQVQEAQQSFRERALADCVGRRITENSLSCVATAKTAESVIDDCFD